MDTPTYQVVADELEAALAAQPAGARVASEHELAKRYGVNRLTARAALDELEQRHVVRRKRGSGTFVKRRYDFVVSPMPTSSWSQVVRANGGAPRPELLRATSTRTAPPHAQAALGRGALSQLDRLGWVNDERALYKTSWLIPKLVPGLADHLAAHDSLFTTLDQAYDLRPRRHTISAELVRPPEAVAEALELRRNTEVIHALTRTDSGRLDKPVEVTDSWLRTDIFRLVALLAQDNSR